MGHVSTCGRLDHAGIVDASQGLASMGLLKMQMFAVEVSDGGFGMRSGLLQANLHGADGVAGVRFHPPMHLLRCIRTNAAH